MKLIIVKDYEEMSAKAAELVLKDIKKNPKLVVGFATGSTPLGLYDRLAKSKIDFSSVTTFNLDEYYPIKKNNPQSYSSFMKKNLFDKINVKNVNLLNGESKNHDKECSLYEQKIKKKGIDLQILGIGSNGHIGFNEPMSSFDSKTRLVHLNKKTIKDNSRFFNSLAKVPNAALTMGIGTIMESKKIMLLAHGKSKGKAVKAMVNGEVDENCPASILQKHKNVIVIIDKAASLLLRKP